jgi:hypothetical protein
VAEALGMRGLRSFAALVVVLIGLGAYLYFVESKRTPGDSEDARDKVFAVEADAIDEISVRSESGDRTTLRKTGTEWQIVEPAGLKPDPAEISSLTSNLSSLEIQRVLDENAANLDEYGLEPPRFDVAFKSGGQDHKLLLGSKTPPGSDLYARLDNQKRVFLVPAHIESTFNQNTFDLRDKTIVGLDREAIDRLEVTSSAGSVALAKADTEWTLTQPVTAPADFSTVSSLISRLTNAQMKSIETAPGAHGLDKPAATVTINAGTSRETLQIGAPAGEGSVYARAASRPEVFTIESSLLDDLTKTPSDYRQKDLFEARTFNATRLEVTRGGLTAAFERGKVKDKDGKELDGWRQVTPAQKDMDGARVDAFLTTATGVQAQTFVEDAARAGLGKPELTVVITFDEGKKEDRVTFARVGTAAYAGRAGMSGAAAIEPALLDSLLKAFEDIIR